MGDGPQGLRGDLARLLSDRGTHGGRPTVWIALQRAITRPGPLAILLYRESHQLWRRSLETPAELIWRISFFLTGADIHPGAEIGGGLRLTHTAGLVIGKGVRIGSGVTLLHGVTLGGSSRGFFEDNPVDGFPEIRDAAKIAAGAKILGPVVVGEGAFVAANAVVAKDVAAGAVFNPGRVVGDLKRRVEELEEEVARLKAALDATDHSEQAS